MKCKTCKKEKTEQDFYKGFTECKDCLGDYLNEKSITQGFEEVKDLLQDNNYIVNQELLHDIFFSKQHDCMSTNNLGKLSDYLRKINSLPQYKEYKYKTINEEKSDINFLNDDIKQLKKNIEKSIQKEDFNAHNKWMNCLRDAIEMRERLDCKSKWREFSSHYYEGDKAIKGENEYIAIWEQKGDEIRNKKVYKVEKEVPSVAIEIDKNYIVDGDNLTIPMKINGKDGYSIHGKKVDNKWVFKNGDTVICK